MENTENTKTDATSDLSASAGSAHIYPQSVECNDGISRWTESKGGLTLRQHYAGLAMAALLANPEKGYDPEGAAHDAAQYADALCLHLQNK